MSASDGTRVQPDVIVRFRNMAVLVEAKRADDRGGHSWEQLDRQLSAAKNDPDFADVEIIQLAVGGKLAVGPVLERAKAHESAVLVHATWASLLSAALDLTHPRECERTILSDLEAGLDLFAARLQYRYFGSLVAAGIRTKSPRAFERLMPERMAATHVLAVPGPGGIRNDSLKAIRFK